MRVLCALIADRHLPGLKEIASRKFPDTPFKHLGIRINLTRHPPVLGVFSLEKAMSDPTFQAREEVQRMRHICSGPTSEHQLNTLIQTEYFMGGLSDKLSALARLAVYNLNTLGGFWNSDVSAQSQGKGSPVPRYVCVDEDNQPLETIRDYVDVVLEHLGYVRAIDWLKAPLLKPGDRIKILNDKVDELTTNLAEKFKVMTDMTQDMISKSSVV